MALRSASTNSSFLGLLQVSGNFHPPTSLPPYGTEFVQAKEEILEEAIPAAQRKAKEAAQQRWDTVEMWEAIPGWFGKKDASLVFCEPKVQFGDTVTHN